MLQILRSVRKIYFVRDFFFFLLSSYARRGQTEATSINAPYLGILNKHNGCCRLTERGLWKNFLTQREFSTRNTHNTRIFYTSKSWMDDMCFFSPDLLDSVLVITYCVCVSVPDTRTRVKTTNVVCFSAIFAIRGERFERWRQDGRGATRKWKNETREEIRGKKLISFFFLEFQTVRSLVYNARLTTDRQMRRGDIMVEECAKEPLLQSDGASWTFLFFWINWSSEKKIYSPTVVRGLDAFLSKKNNKKPR